jgi:hypothetical protein
MGTPNFESFVIKICKFLIKNHTLPQCNDHIPPFREEEVQRRPEIT